MATGNKADALRIIAERTSDCALAQVAVADLSMVVTFLAEAGHEGTSPFYRRALDEAHRVAALVCEFK
jgi:hypothetical protein